MIKNLLGERATFVSHFGITWGLLPWWRQWRFYVKQPLKQKETPRLSGLPLPLGSRPGDWPGRDHIWEVMFQGTEGHRRVGLDHWGRREFDPQSPPSWPAHLQGGHSLRGVSAGPFPKGGHPCTHPGHVSVVVLLAGAGCGAGGTLRDWNCSPGPCDQLPLVLLPLLGLSLSHLQSCPSAFSPLQPCACSPNLPPQPPESVPPPCHWYHSHAFKPLILQTLFPASTGQRKEAWISLVAACGHAGWPLEASWGLAFSPCT